MALSAAKDEARSYAIDSEWRMAVMESIRDAMVLCDSEGLVVEMNRAFTDLLGYRIEDGPFHPPYPWWPTDEEDTEGRHNAELFYEEIHAGGTRERELVYFTRDRAKVWVNLRGIPIHHGSLGTTYLRVMRDVSRGREAQRRRATAVQVSQAFALLGDLGELIGVAEHGFGVLFDGSCTIQFTDGQSKLLFNSKEYPRDADLPIAVRIGLEGEPSPDTVSLRPGILLVPDGPGMSCRAWVQFPRPRAITVEEMIVADLLGSGFAAAVERLSTAQEFSERETNLEVAVESHRLIGQATGVLVERHRILPVEAFELLRGASQRRNVKLRDLAALVVETGVDPRET